MNNEDIRQIKYFSYCLARDEASMDTYAPGYFDNLYAMWELYKRCGLDEHFEPSAKERAETQELCWAIKEKVEFLEKLGLLQHLNITK